MAAPTDTHGGRIIAARVLAGLSRKELAAALGVTYQRVADIEADRKPATLETILRVAEALGCDPHSIDERLASVRPVRRKAALHGR